MPETIGAIPHLSGIACIYFIQKWAKTFGWYARFVQAFPGADKWAHRAFAAVCTFVVAVGIHASFSGDAGAGWAIHITIPNLETLMHGAQDFIVSFPLQQWFYDAANRQEWTPFTKAEWPSMNPRLVNFGQVTSQPPTPPPPHTNTGSEM